MAVGQAVACLHTEAYQADLLKDLVKDEEVGPNDINKLRWAVSLCHKGDGPCH